MYSITINCDDYERFKEILENMDEIAKKRENKKKEDGRSLYMKTLHRRTKEFHEQHQLIDYKECLSIIADQMKVEKDHENMKHLVDEMIIDLSNAAVVDE